jgi:hypothetical protein
MIAKVKSGFCSFFRERGVPLTSSDKVITAYRGRHAGETCFILGSGPSLTFEDMEKIKGLPCFGVNKVYLAYPHVSWRPTYYALADRRVAEQVKEHVHQVTCPRFVAKWASGPVLHNSPWVVLRDLQSRKPVDFSQNLLLGAYGGGSVIYTAIQIAYYMGFSTVVLLGIDFSYSGLTSTGNVSAAGEVLVKSDDRNYFIPGYTSPADVQAAPRYEELRKAFLAAYEAYAADGRVLVNASRKTALDVIPRATLEDYL